MSDNSIIITDIQKRIYTLRMDIQAIAILENLKKVGLV